MSGDLPYAEVRGATGDGSKTMGDFAQRCDFAQMKEHGDELVPATESLAVLVTVAFADNGPKFGGIDNRGYDLGENAGSFARHMTLRVDGGTSVCNRNLPLLGVLFWTGMTYGQVHRA